jgi:hypothetical protein
MRAINSDSLVVDNVSEYADIARGIVNVGRELMQNPSGRSLAKQKGSLLGCHGQLVLAVSLPASAPSGQHVRQRFPLGEQHNAFDALLFLLNALEHSTTVRLSALMPPVVAAAPPSSSSAAAAAPAAGAPAADDPRCTFSTSVFKHRFITKGCANTACAASHDADKEVVTLDKCVILDVPARLDGENTSIASLFMASAYGPAAGHTRPGVLCTVCGKKTDRGYKEQFFGAPPPVLFVKLSRYELNKETDKFEKRTAKVNVGNLTVPFYRDGKWEQAEFAVMGTIEHEGSTDPNHGHCTATAKTHAAPSDHGSGGAAGAEAAASASAPAPQGASAGGPWLYFDDERVTALNEPQHNADNTYIIAYELVVPKPAASGAGEAGGEQSGSDDGGDDEGTPRPQTRQEWEFSQAALSRRAREGGDSSRRSSGGGGGGGSGHGGGRRRQPGDRDAPIPEAQTFMTEATAALAVAAQIVRDTRALLGRLAAAAHLRAPRWGRSDLRFSDTPITVNGGDSSVDESGSSSSGSSSSGLSSSSGPSEDNSDVTSSHSSSSSSTSSSSSSPNDYLSSSLTAI